MASELLAAILAIIGAGVGLALVLFARREAAAIMRRAESKAAQIDGEALASKAEAQRLESVARSVTEETLVTKEQLNGKLLDASEELRAAEAARRRNEDAERTQLDLVQKELQRVSALDIDDARRELITKIEAEARECSVSVVRRVEEQAAKEAEMNAKSILVTAVQRLAAPTSSESVVTIVRLRSEELKGRVIGREGRNIRTFEALTGVNLVVDDSPDSVMLSCFDPGRREIATVALEELLLDGRIHPQRIETAVAAAKAGAPERTTAAGYQAAEQAGISGLAPEVIGVLGGLRLRTSYGQNVLAHLVETSLIARNLAAELGLDLDLAGRAAFLHDIGKGLQDDSHEAHAIAGAKFLEDRGESTAVVNAVAAHHNEISSATLEAVLVQAADAASAARPGARRDEMDQYLDRMRRLEAMIKEHPAVRKVFAISAGREVRVAVEPSLLDDKGSQLLASELAQRVERELSYPGQIKIIVIRELKASATAS